MLISQGMNATTRAHMGHGQSNEFTLKVYLWGLEALEIQSRAGRQCPSLRGGQAFQGIPENLCHLLGARSMVSVRKMQECFDFISR